jgi:hypothetical protein
VGPESEGVLGPEGVWFGAGPVGPASGVDPVGPLVLEPEAGPVGLLGMSIDGADASGPLSIIGDDDDDDDDESDDHDDDDDEDDEDPVSLGDIGKRPDPPENIGGGAGTAFAIPRPSPRRLTSRPLTIAAQANSRFVPTVRLLGHPTECDLTCDTCHWAVVALAVP